MLRLIACDLDGTLLDAKTHEMPPDAFALIRAFHEEGVAFAAASGRQLTNLRNLFAPVDDAMYYLCENGALIAHAGQVTSFTPFPQEMVLQIVSDLRALGLRLLLSTPYFTYVFDEDRTYTDDIIYRLRNATCVLHEDCEIREPVIKISGYAPCDIELLTEGLREKWSGQASAVVAGKHWFDITLTTKGSGISTLCDTLRISPQDAAAFGDYFNDLDMLCRVGHPFVMENAPDGMKRPGFTLCRCVPETLRNLLRQKREGTL